jgi:hypothetical protein
MMALQHVLDPAIEALLHSVCLRLHRQTEAILDPEFGTEVIELVRASRWRDGGGDQRARSVNSFWLSLSTRVILIGAARSRSRRKRRVLAAVFAG